MLTPAIRRRIVRFRYFDPSQQATVEGEVHTATDVAELMGLVLRLPGSHAPAVEFAGHDGSSLVVGVAGPRAVVLWTDVEGHTAHTVAASSADLIGDGVVFDYFGAYTEMPAGYSVPTDVAVAAAVDYVVTGAAPVVLMALDV
jgi:hypothetical protein